ncbi:MAG TPA: BON domain-containing protein [Terriglobales bacterium]|nr:BON domain-containing protein [Terriglobales bacterium]
MTWQRMTWLALLLMLGVLPQAMGQTAPPHGGSVDLQHAVAQALILNSDLGQYPLTVTVDSGSAVTLDGVLPNAQDRTAAENVAKAVPGVTQVTDHIVVDAAASLLADGAATPPASLAAMQFRIQNALDSDLALVAVTASVYPQLVTLTGYVATAADKARAGELAQQDAAGVKVANAIAVSPANAPAL